MEFMGFFCAKFVNKTAVSLIMLTWSVPAWAQAKSDVRTTRENEPKQGQQVQEQQPQNSPSQSSAVETPAPQTPAAQTPAAQTPGPETQPLLPPTDATAAARQAAPPLSGEVLHLTFQQALELARKNATQFKTAVVNAGALHAG